MTSDALIMEGCGGRIAIPRGRQLSPVIDVQAAPTLAVIERIVADAGGVERVLLSDLSLGAWRPHQLAAEWAEGLGLAPYPPEWSGARRSAPAQLSFGAIAEAGIEMEALGERVVRDASALSRRLAAELAKAAAPRWLFVVAPVSARPWREENAVFLRFMLAALDDPRRIRVLAGHVGRSADHPDGSAPHLPEGLRWRWLSAAGTMMSGAQTCVSSGIGGLPGLVPPTLVSAFARHEGLVLRHGAMLAAPESRSAAPLDPTFYDRLRPLVSEQPWYDAFAQFAGSNFHLDTASLARCAAAAFDLGAVEIAIDHLQRAIGCARGVQRAGLQCQLQGYRIASHRFEAAASIEVAPATLPTKLAAFLSMARGWGAVMSGRAEQGRIDLARAVELLGNDADDKFRAYLRNITALAFAQLGKLDEATTLELAVQNNNAGVDRSWPLHYVNQINIARLHRRRGDISEARRHYARAFATHWGGRSVNDRVYVNAVMAMLAEAEATPAHPHWLRAALHLAAASTPESFGARHASLLVGKRAFECSREQRVELVAEALAAKIEGGSPVGTATVARDSCPVFAECPNETRSASVLIGGDGWSVIADPLSTSPGFDGASMRRLRRALARCIASTQTRDLSWVASYHVDGRFGREMAGSLPDMIETAARLDIGSILLPGIELSLDRQRRRELIGRCRLRVSPLVSTLTPSDGGIEVRFRRCRPPLTLADPYMLLAAAESGARIGDLIAGNRETASAAQVCAAIAAFEDAGVLWRELRDEDVDAIFETCGSMR